MSQVKRSAVQLALGASLSLAAFAPALAAPLKYPEAPRGNQVDTYFGVQVPDPYRWLEDPASEATQQWVSAQNALTRSFLETPARSALRERLESLWNYPKYGTPRKKGQQYFYWHNNGLQNQYVLYTQSDLNGPARVVLDPNSLSNDGTRTIGTTALSENGELLAYGISEGGQDQQTLHFRDTRSAKDLPDTIPGLRNSSVAWLPDHSGVIYNRYPTASERAALGLDPDSSEPTHSRVYLHRLGTPASEDVLLYQLPEQPAIDLYPGITDDGRYLLIYGYEGTEPNNGLWVKPVAELSQPNTPFRQLVAPGQASFSVAGNIGSRLYLQTTLDAPRGRLVSLDLDQPDAPFEEVLPEQEAVLDSVQLAYRYLVVSYLSDAHQRLQLHQLNGEKVKEIPLPTLGTVGALNSRPDDPELFFSFSSFVYPGESYRYDLSTGSLQRLRRSEVAFDPERFATRQVFYTSADGTRVPMFLVHRKDVEPNGSAPTLLYGYGGFNISLLPHFALAQLPWLEAGGVYAVANLRGGGEYGDEWHRAGMLDQKQNVFDDFIAAAQWLKSSGWSHPQKLAIQGGSNGGLLTAAVMLQQPKLFDAVISQVPVLDMLRYHQLSVGRFWIPEYGSAERSAAEFKTLYAYSPLHNIKPVAYPPLLVMSADHDDRVVPAHAKKFVAAMQHTARSEAPLLLRVETKAGHGAGKPTDKILDEYADLYAFLFRVFGLEAGALQQK